MISKSETAQISIVKSKPKALRAHSFVYGLGDGSKFVEEVSPFLEKYVKAQYNSSISLKGENGPIMRSVDKLSLKRKSSDPVQAFMLGEKVIKAAMGSHSDVKEGESLFKSLSDILEEGEIFEHPFGPRHGLFVNDIRIKIFTGSPGGIVVPIRVKQTVKNALEEASKTNDSVY